MPKIELWNNEAYAIDMACMNIMETVRRGRKKQKAYIEEDNDPDGAASLEGGISELIQAMRTLRLLLERAGWTSEMIGHAYKENANAPD